MFTNKKFLLSTLSAIAFIASSTAMTSWAGPISGGGPNARPVEGIASVTIPGVPDLSDAMESCESGQSPAAQQTMSDARENATQQCAGFTHIADSQVRGSYWTAQPGQDGVPSVDCVAHAELQCWND